MAYPKRTLEAIPEMADEITGEDRCWAIKSEYDAGARRYHFLWITKYDEKEYIVEDSEGNNRADKKVYKTLAGAKRMAEEIMWRQDETGLYSD